MNITIHYGSVYLWKDIKVSFDEIRFLWLSGPEYVKNVLEPQRKKGGQTPLWNFFDNAFKTHHIDQI